MTIDHNLNVEEDYLFVEGLLHVLIYTAIIRYPTIYVYRKNCAYSFNHFYIMNCDLYLLQRKEFIHQLLMLFFLYVASKMLYASYFTLPYYVSFPSCV
jgi:hypothetical protein